MIKSGENYHTEFKEGVDKTLIETVCAFANAEGGKTLLGVSDSGNVVGTDTSNKARSKIQDILSKLQPQILEISIDTVDNLIVIDVPKGKNKPYACSRGFFIRTGPNTQKLNRNEIMKLYEKSGSICFEGLINEKANFDNDFDPLALKRFLSLSKISPKLKQETLLKNLECLTGDKKLTNLGVLFFAKDIDFIMEYAMVDCILFHGNERIKILNRRQYKGNIIDNIENGLAFIQKHTNVEYVITGNPRREEIPDYPEEALREAIVNAVCHRDYFIQETNVVIEVFRDYVRIINPGGLPKGLDPKKFGTESFPRNKMISAMLHRANYIEKAGTGIKRMKEAVKNHKRKIEMKIEYSDDSVFYTIIFSKKKVERSEFYRKEMGQKTPSKSPENTQKTPRKSLENTQKIADKLLILLEKNPNSTQRALSKKAGVTQDSVKYHLTWLKKEGFLKRIGPNKGGYWKVLKPKK